MFHVLGAASRFDLVRGCWISYGNIMYRGEERRDEKSREKRLEKRDQRRRKEKRKK
jgi:hypothetical protein